jgi:hypothetical protein
MRKQLTAAERLRSILLHAALGLYNAAAFALMNLVAWCNGLWWEKRWTPMPFGTDGRRLDIGKTKS